MLLTHAAPMYILVQFDHACSLRCVLSIALTALVSDRRTAQTAHGAEPRAQGTEPDNDKIGSTRLRLFPVAALATFPD